MKEGREEDRLLVSFSQRKDAKDHNAVYIRGSFFRETENGWYAPEQENDTDENGTIVSSGREYLLREYGQQEVAEEKNRQAIWSEAIRSKDTLQIAATLRDLGLPKEEIQRVEILKILRNPGRSLRLHFEDLQDFSPSFRETYSIDRIKEIVEKHIAGGTDYQLTLENSNATNEEKELIKFVFGY